LSGLFFFQSRDSSAILFRALKGVSRIATRVKLHADSTPAADTAQRPTPAHQVAIGAPEAAYEILSAIPATRLDSPISSMYLELTGTNVRLLGSMHLFPASSPRMPAWVAQAFDWSEILVFESDAPAILPLLKREPGTSLEQDLPADVWRRLDPTWPSAGPLAPLSELRPWAALMVAPTLCQRVVEGVEPRMLREATAQAKPYRYLETAAEVAASLESIPLSAVCTGLELLLADLTEPQRMLDRMQEAWLRRDTEAVYRIAAESPMFRLPGIRSALLDGRNRAWAPHVRRALDSKERTLVVVGALHLAGEGSLIECLGHPVKPVSIAV
jgi:uncharacterized protein